MGSLSLKNIRKSFGPVEVLTDINLEVDEGEVVIFLARLVAENRLYYG